MVVGLLAVLSAWTNIGPFGGGVSGLASDRAGNAVFALSSRTGVFRSLSGGPWTLAFDAVSRGVTPTRMAVDSDTSRVYIGTNSGLFRSNDNGITWQLVSSEPIIDVTAAGDRVIISTPMALERSPNAGDTWANIPSPGSDNFNTVSVVRFDARFVERVAAINGGNLFLSESLGSSWQQLPTKNVSSVVFADMIYAGGVDGVFSCDSTDCSQLSADPVIDVAYFLGLVHEAISDGVMRFNSPRWERLIAGFPQANMRALLATPSQLLAGTTTGVYVTTDDATWTFKSEGLANVRIAALATAAGNLLAATREQSVMRRSAGIWTTADIGLPAHPPALPIARVLASDGSTVYAAFSGDGLFRTTNQGLSWNDITAGLPSRDVLDVAADPGIVIAATGSGLVRSNVQGGTWAPFKSFPALAATAVAVKGQTIVAAKAASIYFSTDGGATWQAADLPGTVQKVAVAGSRAYAATDADIFVRTGVGWNRSSLPSARFNAMTAAGSRIYVSETPGIYFSDDGTSWSLVPDSATLPADITALAIDDAFLYAGTNGGSVFTTPIVSPPIFSPRTRAVRH